MNGLKKLIISSFLALNIGCHTKKIIESMAIVTPQRVKGIASYQNMTHREVIAKINNPKDVQLYFDHFMAYEKTNGNRTFRHFHEVRKGDCSEYAIAAAALLSDDGYDPIILRLHPYTNFSGPPHAIFLYRTPEGYGALGNTSMDPVYPSVRELVFDMRNKHDGHRYNPVSTIAINLDDKFDRGAWIDQIGSLDF
jgi:hypothetical protein